MTDTGQFIEDFFEHAVVYDPVYAHDYYLRTRKLKGRLGSKVNPKSTKTYDGKPLKKLGTRMEEDQTPDMSRSGAKLIKYVGAGKGKAVYADGTTYDAVTGWNAKAQRATGGGSKQTRVQVSRQKLARVRALANNVKDPQKKAALAARLKAYEAKLNRLAL